MGRNDTILREKNWAGDCEKVKESVVVHGIHVCPNKRRFGILAEEVKFGLGFVRMPK